MSEQCEVTSPEETKVPEVPAAPAIPPVNQLIFNTPFMNTHNISFIARLRDIKEGAILIFLNSPGGSPSHSLAMAEKISSLKRNVTIISEIYNASMSALFPHIDGVVRLCYPHSIFLYHGASYHFEGNENEIKELQRYTAISDKYWDDIVSKRVGLTSREYKKYCSHDVTLYGKEALQVGEHGMVDGIIYQERPDNQYVIQVRDGSYRLFDARIHGVKDLPNLEKVELETLPITKVTDDAKS